MKKILVQLQSILNRIHASAGNPSGAMQHTLKGGATDPRIELWKPWHPFPNVKDFRVEVSGWDELFMQYGIRRREEPGRLVFNKYKNKPVNRFVEHQILRMNKADDRTYWIIADHLMKRSNVWFLLSVKHIFKRWHRELPFDMLLRWRKQYRELAHKEFKDIDFRRVYQKKKNGKWRPLGVPRPVWRIYLHTLNQFLVKRLESRISNTQHGFRPGKGTLTAWKHILEHVIQAKYIFEYDYKGFFDNLSISFISRVLRAHRVPGHWISMIEMLNKSIPILAKRDLIDETPDRRYPLTGSLGPNPNRLDGQVYEVSYQVQTSFGPVTQYEKLLLKNGKWVFADYPNVPIPDNWQKDWDPKDIVEVSNIKMTNMQDPSKTHGNYIFSGQYSPTKTHGVPQGSPTSPFLSILALDAAMKVVEGTNKLEYADDGILYGETPLQFPRSITMQEANIRMAPEKSTWVKYDGKWLKPLKFLGLEYDGDKDLLRASTRNGSTLEYDKASLLEAIEAGYFPHLDGYTKHTTRKGNWEQFVRSKFAGFLMARLYNGSWNQEELWQSFELSFHTGSWVWRYKKWASWIHQPYYLPKGDTPWEKYTKRQKLNAIREGNATKLTVFNSTSLAILSTLEAFRIAEGKTPRTPLLREEGTPKAPKAKEDPTIEAFLQATGKKGKTWAKSSYHAKMNINRWMGAFCGSPAAFTSFMEHEYDRMAPFTKYSREESYSHWWNKYLRRKGTQIQAVLERGNGLIKETTQLLNQLNNEANVNRAHRHNLYSRGCYVLTT